MGLFKKKAKLSEEEKEQRLDALEARMSKSIKKLEGMKANYFAGMMQARQKKLPTQEKQFRASLARCIAQIHMQEGTLMSLQLSRQNREFSSNQADFMSSIMMISDDIEYNYNHTNMKKVEKSMLKSKFILRKQEEQLDQFLELDQYSNIEDAESGRYQDYNNEIDGMIDGYESNPKNRSYEKINN